MKVVVPVAFLAVAAGLSAQCYRPVPPAGGFAIDVDPAVGVTYSDGYQTFGTMSVPDVAPPACGWPLVVYVHQLGGARFDQSELQALICAQGYAVWSYDVRGQGQADLGNVGHPHRGSTLWGPIERHDLAEQIAFVAASPQWQGVVDAQRTAVVGTSQGGGHGWLAAAWTGETLSLAGRTNIVFPPIRCVIARDLIADSVDGWLVSGALFGAWWINAMTYDYTAMTLDAGLVQQARAAFVAQDPVGLLADYAASGRVFGDRLAQSTVPVLYDHAYHDIVSSPRYGVERLAAIGAPTRALCGTLGHAVPFNELERDASENLHLRWLHRWLWDEANEVDVEVPHVLSMLPLDAAERADPHSQWRRARVATLTPTAGVRLYLHDDQTLRQAVPVGAPLPVAIAQEVDELAPTFTPAAYWDVTANRDLSVVEQACPLVEQVWAIDLVDAAELIGSPLVHLQLEPDGPAWQLAALLTVQPPGGAEVMLAHHAVGSRGSQAAVGEVHELRLPPVAASLPAGTTLRLRLRNLWLREAPMSRSLAAAPIFADFTVDVHLGAPALGSWLDVPLRQPEPRLVVDREVESLVAMEPVTATLHAGGAHAGDPYFCAVGLSGSVPVTGYLNALLPLDADWLVLASAAGQTSEYLGFLGFLDASGRAVIGLDYSQHAPLPQFLNGRNLTMAAFVWDAPWSTTGVASNCCELMLR